MKRADDNENIIKTLRKHFLEIKKELAPCALSNRTQKRFAEIEKLLDEASNQDREGIGISAQVSLYPLRVKSLSPFINEAWNIFNGLGLRVFPGSMSTVISGSDKLVWKALRDAFSACAIHGELVMTVTISNACPVPGKPDQDV